jgi:hypothetical protein
MTCLYYDYLKDAHTDEERVQQMLITVLGDLSHGQTIDLIRDIAAMPPRARTDFWLAARQILPEGRYNQLHLFYIRECLRHRWGQ